jgi:hypothetical protein
MRVGTADQRGVDDAGNRQIIEILGASGDLGEAVLALNGVTDFPEASPC